LQLAEISLQLNLVEDPAAGRILVQRNIQGSSGAPSAPHCERRISFWQSRLLLPIYCNSAKSDHLVLDSR